jgi:glycosyltransferase involved in cell wall biosynthesis
MRILHLAYEDPRQPASGGGSVRAREINRRLADRHEITALVAGYPGAKPRVEDGVRWVPVGSRVGKRVNQLSYFSLLGREIRRHPHDLVVEEFGAPFSTGFSPLFTKKPVVASVQWLFAPKMREQYRLPFDWVETFGLRFYDRFISVSNWLADDLRTRRPGSVVETIPNGVDKAAFETRPAPDGPKHLLYLGRLEIPHKGVDFLLEVYSRLGEMVGEESLPPLVVAGDGPDGKTIKRLARCTGLSHKIRFPGRVEDGEKYRLLADSYAVLMPSMYETFGMVAVEALAAGSPLVTFDVGPLREVTGDQWARLVPLFHKERFAEATVNLMRDPDRRAELREGGRRWARQYEWDRIALQQEDFYLRTLDEAGAVQASRSIPKNHPESFYLRGGETGV